MRGNITIPPVAKIKDIISIENRYYLSSAIEVCLGKYGKLLEEKLYNHKFFTRGVNLVVKENQSDIVFVEGSFDKLFINGNNIVSETAECETLDVYDARKENPIRVLYNSYFEKKIRSKLIQKKENIMRKVLARFCAKKKSPRDGIHISETQKKWGCGNFRVNSFKESAYLEPLYYIKMGQRFCPAIVRYGNYILCGFPLLDMISWQHTMPDLENGYYSHDRYCDSSVLETLLFRLIKVIDEDANSDILLPGSWPCNYNAGFIVRHDYDRRIDDDTLEKILNFYEEKKVKSTWFWLRKTFNKKQINEVIRRGHEVALHTEAHTCEDLVRLELNYLSNQCSFTPLGATSHGGAGGVGYLGNKNIEWYRDSGMLYGELLGNQNRVGHNSINIENGIGHQSSLFIPPAHYSLDLGMKEDQHALDSLQEGIPNILNKGHCCVLMNHPDIHLKQLFNLIENINLESVMKMTFADYFYLKNKSL